MNNIQSLILMMTLPFVTLGFSSVDLRQEDLFTIDKRATVINEVSATSWRNQVISEPNQTIETYLMATVNSGAIAPQTVPAEQQQRYEQIIETTNDKEFWSEGIRQGHRISRRDVFTGNKNSLGWAGGQRTLNEEMASYTNRPINQSKILNSRDIINFNDRLGPLISHDNFETDDVIKALSLSGTFCIKQSELLVPQFSGMLIPGQEYSKNNFEIHTCLHGFKDIKELKDLHKFYFVPYGLRLKEKNAFRVKSLWIKKDADNSALTKLVFTGTSKTDVTVDYLRRHSDYARVVISNCTVTTEKEPLSSQINLKTILEQRQKKSLVHEEHSEILFPGFFKTKIDEHLPRFRINQLFDKLRETNTISTNNNNNNATQSDIPTDIEEYFNPFHKVRSRIYKNIENVELLEDVYKFSNSIEEILDNDDDRYYIIGRPGDSRLEFNKSGFTIVTNVTNKVIRNPLTTFVSDPMTLKPSEIGFISDRMAMDFPGARGMSGGIALQTFCIKTTSGKIYRFALPYGTCCSCDVIVDESKNYIAFKTIINIIKK